MNQKQLSYFIEVYQTCNIQTAADKLYVTRQGVSKVVRALEDELRQTLFERSPHGLKPTDFAKALFPHVKSLLDEYSYISGMNTLASMNQQPVVIYALDHILDYLTAEFLLDFKTDNPGLIPSFVDTTDDNALEELLAQKCDFAIVTGPLDQTQFTGTPLFFSRYCIRLNRSHPLASRDYLTYQDLDGQPLISKGRAYSCFRHNMNEHLLLPGMHLNLLAETADEKIIEDLILRANAINLSYDYAAIMHQHPQIKMLPINTRENGQQIYLVERAGSLPSRAVRIFKQFLLDWLLLHKKDSIAW